MAKQIYSLFQTWRLFWRVGIILQKELEGRNESEWKPNLAGMNISPLAEFMQKSVMARPQIVRMGDVSLIKSSAILITPRFGLGTLK